MLSKVLNATNEQINEAIASVIAGAKEQNLPDKIVFDDVESIGEALTSWESCVKKAGFENLLNTTGPLGKLFIYIYNNDTNIE